ncbi:MAG: penicillin-binding protein 2 [Anaerolineae bacterium]|jgi:penicillin-binding protein 2
MHSSSFWNDYESQDLDDPTNQKLEPLSRAPTRGLSRLLALLVRSPRLILISLLFLALLGILAQRLHRLQVVEAQIWGERAEEQRAELVRVPADRGIVYSRNGELMVRNVPAFRVVVVPALLPDEEDEPEEREAVLRRVSGLISRPYEEVEEIVARVSDPELPSYAPYEALTIARQIDRQLAMMISEEGLTLPGIQVEVYPRRQYPYGSLVAQLVGYLGAIPEELEEEYVQADYDPATDQVGYAGVEASMEEWLRGTPGERYQEEDVLGRPVRIIGEEIPAVPGHNIHLTIDLALQQVTQDALAGALEQLGLRHGVAIAMDPQTGAILSMVSLPTYDNNLFAQGISMADLERLYEDPHRPLLNHAISDNLPPGSIFKIVPAAGALEEGVLTAGTRINCPGEIEVPNRYAPNDPALAQPFYCWNRSGHGNLDVVGGLAQSCDIFFYNVGGGYEETEFEGLGPEKLADYARIFGLGGLTGIELPGESAGLVPDPTWKRRTLGENWSTGDTYNYSIGQGFLQVTPLQMLNIMATTANGGTLYQPQIVHHITDAEGEVVQPFRPVVNRTLPVSDESWDLIHEGLIGAVEYGTAPLAQVEGVRVAGKTGTAQFCDDIARQTGICRAGFDQPTHAWFMAYAPAEAPEIAVIVFIYNGGEGSQVAVPVTQDILDWYFHHEDQETEP